MDPKPSEARKGPHLAVGGQARVIERSFQESHQEVLHLAQAVALTQEPLLQDPQTRDIFGGVKAQHLAEAVQELHDGQAV